MCFRSMGVIAGASRRLGDILLAALATTALLSFFMLPRGRRMEKDETAAAMQQLLNAGPRWVGVACDWDGNRLGLDQHKGGEDTR
jgi:hypothetical protein